jgi:hypothetical protein
MCARLAVGLFQHPKCALTVQEFHMSTGLLFPTTTSSVSAMVRLRILISRSKRPTTNGNGHQAACARINFLARGKGHRVGHSIDPSLLHDRADLSQWLKCGIGTKHTRKILERWYPCPRAGHKQSSGLSESATRLLNAKNLR